MYNYLPTNIPVKSVTIKQTAKQSVPIGFPIP